MAFGVYMEIVCDTCASHIFGEWSYKRSDRKMLAEEARKKGAILWENNWFCSQQCLDDMKESCNG